MSEPLFPHGVTCGRCGKRLLPGGTVEQRPHQLRVDIPGVPIMPWEVAVDAVTCYELVCKACFDVASAA